MDLNYNDTGVLKSIIQNFKTYRLPKYHRYNNEYNGKHKVLFREGQLNGIENKLVVNFQRQIIDTSHNYLLAKPLTYKTKCNEEDIEMDNIDEFIERLIEIFEDNDEHHHTSNLLKHTAILGDGFEYWYINTDGSIKCMEFPATEGHPVYNPRTQEMDAFLRIFEVKELLQDGTTSIYHNLEVYDKEKITYYIYKNGGIYLDTSISENPKYHFLGEVPVVHFANNKKIGSFLGQSDLKDTLSLISNYEEVVSDLADTIQYHASPYYVLENAIMDSEQMEEVHQTKMFMLPEDAKISYLTWQQDVNAIQFHLDLLKKNILELSNTPDLNTDANTTLSGVAIKMKFAGADLKANNKEIEYKKGLKQRVKFISKLLNLLENKDYSSKKIDILFNRSIPQNIGEIADTMTKLNGIVSKETLLAQIPFVDDVDAEITRLSEENTSSMDLDKMYPEYDEEEDTIDATEVDLNDDFSPSDKS